MEVLNTNGQNLSPREALNEVPWGCGGERRRARVREDRLRSRSHGGAHNGSPVPLRPGEQRRQQPGPGEQRRQQPGPGEQRRQQPGPGEQRRQQPGPGEQRRQQPGPGEQRRQQPGPGEQQRQQPGPGEQQQQPGPGEQQQQQQQQPGPGEQQQQPEQRLQRLQDRVHSMVHQLEQHQHPMVQIIQQHQVLQYREAQGRRVSDETQERPVRGHTDLATNYPLFREFLETLMSGPDDGPPTQRGAQGNQPARRGAGSPQPARRGVGSPQPARRRVGSPQPARVRAVSPLVHHMARMWAGPSNNNPRLHHPQEHLTRDAGHVVQPPPADPRISEPSSVGLQDVSLAPLPELPSLPVPELPQSMLRDAMRERLEPRPSRVRAYSENSTIRRVEDHLPGCPLVNHIDDPAGGDAEGDLIFQFSDEQELGIGRRPSRLTSEDFPSSISSRDDDYEDYRLPRTFQVRRTKKKTQTTASSCDRDDDLNDDDLTDDDEGATAVTTPPSNGEDDDSDFFRVGGMSGDEEKDK
ncbi:glutenin, high molecular weight subunit PW212-like [Homarus americanus]|nr:glutenin, high molecular weight subunit PW212-like [Homarus americanus]